MQEVPTNAIVQTKENPNEQHSFKNEKARIRCDMINNFDIVRDNLLKFDREGEFYMVLVLRRRKDIKGNVAEGVNEDNRLVKHFFVYDKEYFDRKRQAIINLCKQNNARAYILPQRRSHDIVMWALHNKTGDILKDGAKNTHFDHLIRSCVAGIHEVPPNAKWHKRWVIDLDEDEYAKSAIGSIMAKESSEPLSLDFYSHFLWGRIRAALVGIDGVRSGEAISYMPDLSHKYESRDVTLLRTPHGWHIVTPPFNRESNAMKNFFGVDIPSAWIKPDAMTLIYSPNVILKKNGKDGADNAADRECEVLKQEGETYGSK